MQLAMSARQNSGCISRHVGAVVVNSNGYVLGVGWNDPPHGQVPCSLRTTGELLTDLNEKVFSEYERGSDFINHIRSSKLSGQPFCFKEELFHLTGKKHNEYTRALHAEENALLQSMTHGPDTLQDSILYTTDSPCTLCSKKAYQLGVKRIVFVEEYPGISVSQSLRVGDREIVIEQFEGVTGSAYFKLYSPLMPEKDYLKLYA
jgi:dCMP deaminase